MSEDDVAATITSSGSSLTRDVVVKYSAGLPALVRAILDSTAQTEGREEARRAAAERTAREMSVAIRQLGPDVVSTLDNLILELGVNDLQFDELGPFVVEALRGAGLARSPDGWQTVAIGFDGPLQAVFAEALREYVDSTVELPSSYFDAVRDMWFIERSVRAQVLSQARDRHGNDWRLRICDEETATRIVARASLEAYPSASSIDSVPNPLEWMTLGELLSLVASEPWARPWGLPASYWAKFRGDLAPVRDRLAHMRLLRAGDSATIRRWRHHIDRVRSETVDS